MQYSPLDQVQQRVKAGQALPFNIFDHDRTLLLARGQRVETHEQLQALFSRGALVDLGELRSPADTVRLAPAKELPQLWNRCLGDLANTLRHASHDGFVATMETTTPAVMALVERDKDLAIFQVLRQSASAHAQYGVNHSIHTAITAFLVAQRLGWSEEEAQRAFKTGLTMNVSMLELQGQLAEQTTPLTDAQRDQVRAHPDLSRMMLEMSGVSDPLWLQAVSQHHEHSDGSGYPTGLRESSDTAALVRLADIYCAKLSPRAGRDAVAADLAGRQMFMQDPGHPMTAGLVKEFGIYPPGCMVRLASGESGMVVKRGGAVNSPIVAVLVSANGVALLLPVRRDSAQAPYAIQRVLGGKDLVIKLAPERLMAMVSAA